MDKAERMLRFIGNAIVVVGSIYVIVADPDVEPKAQVWRAVARGSSWIAERAGKLNLHAQDRYYKAVQP